MARMQRLKQLWDPRKIRLCALLFWPWIWRGASGRCEPRLHTYKSCAHRVPLNSLKKTTSGAESKTIFARLLLELGWNQKFFRTRLPLEDAQLFYRISGETKKQATAHLLCAPVKLWSIHFTGIVLIELSAWWKGARASLFATCIILASYIQRGELLH